MAIYAAEPGIPYFYGPANRSLVHFLPNLQ